jgi:hypothetical protein
MVAETLTGTRAASSFPVFSPPHGSGALCVAWGSYSVAANVEDGDIFQLCKLPKCTVVGGAFWASDMDTGTEALDIDIGHAGNATDTADPDAFVNSGVLSGDAITDLIPAGVNYRPFNMSAGPVSLAAETVVQAEANVAAATFAAGTIYVVVYYLVP